MSRLRGGAIAGHPRLMWTPERIASARRRLTENHAGFCASLERLVHEAEELLKAPPPEYIITEGRLLKVSQDSLRRVYVLGTAWLLTGDERYADGATGVLRTICAFPDWHFAHSLDMAEMTHAAAVGYDWLHGRMNESERHMLRESIRQNALLPAVEAFDSDEGPRWMNGILRAYNWNLVCNGGLIIGACALADDDSGLAERIIELARPAMQPALQNFSPDGCWPEGVDYWSYALRYAAYATEALEGTFGSDGGLFATPGLSASARLLALTQAPSGEAMQWGDTGGKWLSDRARWLSAWSAVRFADPLCAAAAQAVSFADESCAPEQLIWYAEPAEKVVFPLDVLAEGPVGVACLRSGWGDPAACWVAVKTGFNRANHGHLDLGGFELELDGVRWAIDLGTDDYELEGNWDRHEDGARRWQYFRYGSSGHNVLMINGSNQLLDGHAQFVEANINIDSPAVTIDISSAYKDQASLYRRTVALENGRSEVLIRDIMELPSHATIEWNMLTRAAVEIDGGEVLLSQDGKKLRLRMELAPAGGRWRCESAQQPPPQSANKGVNRLIYKVKSAAGNAELCMRLLRERAVL